VTLCLDIEDHEHPTMILLERFIIELYNEIASVLKQNPKILLTEKQHKYLHTDETMAKK
jgi:hypothetical protein